MTFLRTALFQTYLLNHLSIQCFCFVGDFGPNVSQVLFVVEQCLYSFLRETRPEFRDITMGCDVAPNYFLSARFTWGSSDSTSPT